MSTASVTFDRTSLSLGALVINDSSSTYRLTPDGLGDPAMTWRLQQMPDSEAIHGTEYTAASLQQSSLELEVIVMGTSAANLRVNRDALTAALSQFTYDVTVTVDGVSDAWSCAPGSWAAGQVRHEMAAALLQILKVSIPVYPVSS